MRVHDSQAYRKMDVTGKCISRKNTLLGTHAENYSKGDSKRRSIMGPVLIGKEQIIHSQKFFGGFMALLYIVLK